MDLAKRFRVASAGAIALAATGSIAFASGVTAGPPAATLLPDLRTMQPPKWDPEPLSIGRNSNGVVAIRISNRIGNQGAGPLELYPEPATDSDDIDCTVGQYTDPHDRDANQRIWEDTDGDGAWDPEVDQVSEQPKVGCFEYHPAHSHWHFQDFSSYALRDRDTGELVAGPSTKIGFCILDGDRFGKDLPGSPDSGEYPGGDAGCGGGGDPPTPPGTMGLSIGWADTYTSGLPGQRLDITGVPSGRYCLVSTANPEHATDDQAQIVESNPDNNARRRLVKINPDKRQIKTVGACPAPPG